MKKQTARKQYKGKIAGIGTMFFACAVMTIYTLINFSKILNCSSDKTVGIIFLVIIFGSCAVLFISSIVQMIIAIKNYNHPKKH